jgi:hypothetical protein
MSIRLDDLKKGTDDINSKLGNITALLAKYPQFQTLEQILDFLLSGTPPPTTTPLASPTNLRYDQLAITSVRILWNTVSNATGYVVQRATNSGFTANLVTLPAITSGSTLSLTDSGLTANTQYYYRVKATTTNTSYTESPYSSSINLTTLANTGGVDQPGFVSATVSQFV